MGYISELDLLNLKVGDVVYDDYNREVPVVDKTMEKMAVFIHIGVNCTQKVVLTNEQFSEKFSLFKREKSTKCKNQ